MIRNNMMVNFS